MELEAASTRGHTLGTLSFGLTAALRASVGLSTKEPPGLCHRGGRCSCPRILKRYVTVLWQGEGKTLAEDSDSHRIRPLFGQVAVCSYQRSDRYVIPRDGYILAFLGTVVS